MTNPILTPKQIDSPLEELIDRSMEQRDICRERGLYEMARTFQDVARFLYALKVAANL